MEIQKDKKSKVFQFSPFLFNCCQTTDRRRGLECENSLTMGQFVVSVSFRQEIVAICRIFLNFLSFSMQFLYNFREISLYVPTQSTTKERAMHFFEQNVAAFCFKNTE